MVELFEAIFKLSLSNCYMLSVGAHLKHSLIQCLLVRSSLKPRKFLGVHVRNFRQNGQEIMYVLIGLDLLAQSMRNACECFFITCFVNLVFCTILY